MIAALGKWRRSAIAKIHVGQKKLGLDDVTYRALLVRVSGHASARDLKLEELGLVLDEMKRLGFVEGNVHTAKLDDFKDAEPQHRFIRALWADLKALGALRDGSEVALRRFIQGLTEVAAIQWLGPREANIVIEALKAWKRRVTTSAARKNG